jgi:hypothetical protein
MSRHDHSGEIVVTSHPPERGRLVSPVTLACGCCCCCCCCLHMVGGVIGGLTGSLLPVAPRPKMVYDPDAPFPFRRDEFYDEEEILFSPTLLYWLLVLGLTSLFSVGWFVAEGGMAQPEYLLWGFLLAVFGLLPFLQLGASLLTCLVVAVFYTDKRTAFVRVGKITLWSFVGALIGTCVMLGACIAMTGGSVFKNMF